MATTINQHRMGLDGTDFGRDTGSFGKEVKHFPDAALNAATSAGLSLVLCFFMIKGVVALSALLLSVVAVFAWIIG